MTEEFAFLGLNAEKFGSDPIRSLSGRTSFRAKYESKLTENIRKGACFRV